MALKLILGITTIILVAIFLIFVRAITTENMLTDMGKLVAENQSITREVAQNITAGCKKGNQVCLAYDTIEWVNRTIKAKEDTFFEGAMGWGNDVKSTYENGGDCENFAIFTASVWKELGFKDIYLLIESLPNTSNTHLFAGLMINKDGMIFSDYQNGTIYGIKKVT